MPLLPLEPYLFPEDILERPAETVVTAEDRWWVLHTHPRAEKALARQFMSRQLPFYLPLYHRQWRNKGRDFRSHVPLFPGYIFLHGDSQVRLAALETKLVANVLPVIDQDQLHGDLMRVNRLIASGSSLAPEDRLQAGTWVEITQGALAGLKGKIIRRDKHCRFLVEVEFLQRGVSAEVEGWMIEPLHERPQAAAVPCGGLER